MKLDEEVPAATTVVAEVIIIDDPSPMKVDTA